MAFILLGCSKHYSTAKDIPHSTIGHKCRVEDNVLHSGQIRYFNEMNLKLVSCPNVVNFSFDTVDAAQKVFSVLDMETFEVDFQYVNIEFYGVMEHDGSVRILRVENSQITENSTFEYDLN